jgi:hypothetical protein
LTVMVSAFDITSCCDDGNLGKWGQVRVWIART